MKRPALTATGIVAAVVLLAIALPSPASSAPVKTAAAAVPTCVKPTGTISNAKLLSYIECRSNRLEALIGNLGTTAPPTTTPPTTPAPTTPVPTTPAPTTPAPTTPPPTTQPPQQTGFPNASNTGVPAGTVLTDYTGPMRITTPGTVIDAKRINGSLTIAAANVTVRRSTVESIGVDSGNLLVEDTRIDVGDQPGTGLGEVNFTAVRVHITGGNRGVNCYDGCTVRDSYVHGQFNDPTETYHMSGMRMGMNTTYIHNTISCDDGKTGDASGCSAALTGYGDFSPVQNNLIQGNLIQATPAWYCAYGGSSASKPFAGQARDIRFIDNVFERGSTRSCGRGWAVTDFDGSRPGNVWSGNRWDDGAVVNP